MIPSSAILVLTKNVDIALAVGNVHYVEPAVFVCPAVDFAGFVALNNIDYAPAVCKRFSCKIVMELSFNPVGIVKGDVLFFSAWI